MFLSQAAHKADHPPFGPATREGGAEPEHWGQGTSNCFDKGGKMSDERLQVKLLSKNARLPTQGSESSAGYDIYAAENVTIPPCSSASIKTDIAVTVPPGTYGQLAGRSGFTRKNHATVEAGVIDRDYTGPLEILMFNHSGRNLLDVEKGDRIAQLLLIRIANPDVIQVEELVKTVRGSGGFGSTGCA